MFSPLGPSLRELARQALSSVEDGYDLLAPKFDYTPFRTSGDVLDATADALRPLGPFGRGLDVRALPFAGAFDLAVSFGALGHFLAAERPALFAGVYRALRPGGVFAFPVAAPQPVTSGGYWAVLGFDPAMRIRNAYGVRRS
jgi:SAM-dependent methyltransferase